ncbi:hypothetical protein PRIPAC_94973 [Pristionchus pacificus]|uniref:Uncharacterized protein n=1 Tax=Pristionchus pacificus TaxID=54126 RepID=A0A2A6BAR8_PRIPA|nr:hypothetical protein PRIPAC_94973 [Pristionchus pacificus]|eukprot:PDM62968.1 hypothetical protein PRIPAC_50183 [Pristionchus pacificus]
MNMPIVIITLKNPEIHSFRDSRFLSCANPLRICPTLTQTASYNFHVYQTDWKARAEKAEKERDDLTRKYLKLLMMTKVNSLQMGRTERK